MEIEETEKKRIRKNKKYDGRLSERMCGLQGFQQMNGGD